jgi:AmmeMemoRadiSam system protein B
LFRHAGYSYSGPAAAWAYASLDLSKAKRIFLLGPSHHFYLKGSALSKHAEYATPLGNLRIDTEIVKELQTEAKFEMMDKSTDEDEHSMEMQCPYIYKMLSLCKESPLGVNTPIVPIMVGNTDMKTEKIYGEVLAPYMKDPENVWLPPLPKVRNIWMGSC